MFEGNGLSTAEHFMFFKASAEQPINPNNVSFHYWFDQDVENIQSVPYGNGQFVVDAYDLAPGIHLLYVMLEGNDLSTAEHFMFFKTSAEQPINHNIVSYRCWFDQDTENQQTGSFGNGSFLVDASGLDNGLHLLYIMLEGDGLSSTEHYMFYKASSENPINLEDVTYRYWFDQDVENQHTGAYGNGGFLLDVSELEDGTHLLYIMLESGAVTATEFYSFEKEGTNAFSIVAVASPMYGGIISGDGMYDHGTSCDLTAIPNINYSFVNWTENDEVVSNDMVYSFSVENSRIISANFVEDFDCEDFFHEEDTIVCDADSFYWHGNNYTESGVYYDILQTVHGCDSIYKLSLEFFNTPLGEFASMIPTNNYPFTSLPITFRWDAVSGVEYYDLFVWNANEQMPAEPIKTKLYNRSFVVNSLPNHQSYKWCIVANNHCHINMSAVRNFTLDIPPAMNVNTNAMSFGETNLNSDKTMSLYVSATALNDSISIQLIGEDTDMFSFVKDNAWNNWNGGMIYVTFNPTVVKYNFNATLEITSGDITETVSLSGSIADVFVFNTYVTQDVFEMNSTIPIYGSVTYNNDIPIAAADVEVKVNVMGTTRSLFTTTNNDGQFEVDFIPANSESGYYTINSGRVGHNSTAIHDDFNIPGMSLVTTGYILWDVTQGQETTGSIIIKNRSQLPLTNITVAAISQPEGCSFTFQPLSIGGMDEGLLEYSVTGSTLTNGYNYEEVKLVVTSSEGAVLNFSTWYYCVEPRGVLYVEPNHITTTMTRGNNKIVDVMLYNNGTGPTGDVTIEIPSEDWLSVVGNHVLPSIAVHDSAYFSLRLAADNTTPLVQYTGNIAINCENGYGVPLSYNITAVSDSTGVLVVDVTDDYTYNGNGQHLAGATVTVKGYYSLETVAAGLTGSDGKFVVNDIPEGYYRLSISAPQHEHYSSNIQIDGGQTNTQNIYLQYQAITYSWNVVPTEIEDEYTFELVVQYETNVPVPVVTIEMPYTFPELEEGESFVFNYVITNHGLVDACETTLYPPTSHPLYDFTPLITDIDTLHAQTTVLVPCTMTRRITERSPKVYAALHQNGNRDEYSCPYYAQTKTKQYYMCGNEKIWFWATVGRNIGETTCETVPYSYTPGAPSAGGSGGGGGAGAGGGSYSPQIVVVHNSGCDSDDCLDNIKNTIDNCNSNGGGVTSPNLPPKKPANNN